MTNKILQNISSICLFFDISYKVPNKQDVSLIPLIQIVVLKVLKFYLDGRKLSFAKVANCEAYCRGPLKCPRFEQVSRVGVVFLRGVAFADIPKVFILSFIVKTRHFRAIMR